MNLKPYIEEKREVLKPFLLEFLQEKKKNTNGLEFLADAIGKLENFVADGKMLRGILAMSSYEMFGGKDQKSVVPVAAALEFTHSALLIHDDIMDNDLKRRGKPTMFAQYINESEKLHVTDAKSYGISQAISVGDISLFYSYELLNQGTGDAHLIHKVSQFFTDEIAKVGAAQMQDVAFGYSADDPDISQILQVYVYKSGRYTFSLPLVIGAILAVKDRKTTNLLDTFGEKLGTIFQIKDDEIGIFGDEEEIGKPIGSDIRENKKTIFRALLFNKANSEELKFLQTVFGNEQITHEEVEQVKQMMEKHEILQETNEIVEKLLEEVYENLHNISVDTEYKKLLEEFIQYNLKRSA